MRKLREAQLARVFESGETLRLQFPREDLGFEYGASPGAAVALAPPLQTTAAGRPGVEPDEGRGSAPPPRGAPFVPSTCPGARLPHAPVQVAWRWGACGDSFTLQQQQQEGGAGSGEVSTLDLVPYALADEPQPPLTLVLGAGMDALRWSAAAVQLSARPRGSLLPLALLLVAPRADVAARDAAAARLAELLIGDAAQHSRQQPQQRTGHRVLAATVAEDICGAWATARQVGKGGALLVRPDGHVAWRAMNMPVAGSDSNEAQLAAQLEAAINAAISRWPA